MVAGRSSGFRINLLFAPSHLIYTKQWYLQISSPITAAGPLPIHTGFPIKPLLGTLRNGIQEVRMDVNKKNEFICKPG